MSPDDFAAARAALVAARRDAQRIAECPAAWHPVDLPEAYRLQAAVVDALGAIGGWKVGALTAEQRRTMGVAVPVGAPLPLETMHDASSVAARLLLGRFIEPRIECEFAFQLGADLPARPDAYARAEVQAAIAALRIAIEIVDPRLPRGSGTLAEIADGFNNGGFIAGPSTRDWRAIEFATTQIVLVHVDANGESRELARGNGGAILDGDPFAAVVFLANAQPDAARGLRAGDIVTTGSCTGAPRVPGPGDYRADFAGIGSIALSFA